MKVMYESLSGDKRVTLGKLIIEYMEFYFFFFAVFLSIPVGLLILGLYSSYIGFKGH